MKKKRQNKDDTQERQFFAALGDGMSFESAAKFAGLPLALAEQNLFKVRFSIPSNDSQIDDMLREAEAIDSSLFLGEIDHSEAADLPAAIQRQPIIDDLAEKFAPEGLRDLAQTLLRIADAIDQDWRPEEVRAAYHWPSGAARIERNAVVLAKRAKAILQFRQDRAKSIPAELVGEPAWDMLLELFCQFSGGAAVSSKSLCISSGVPASTALRQIDKLENAGLITRRTSDQDRRVTLVELTKKGVLAVGGTLEKLA
jgi:DNA-binding MarR family transcriptional regulator